MMLRLVTGPPEVRSRCSGPLTLCIASSEYVGHRINQARLDDPFPGAKTSDVKTPLGIARGNAGVVIPRTIFIDGNLPNWLAVNESHNGTFEPKVGQNKVLDGYVFCFS